MPGTKVWLGGAAAVAQVDTVTIPDDMAAGKVIVATIGYKTISYTVLSTDTRDTIIDALVALWNASTIPEFAEVTAAVDFIDGYEDEEYYSGDIILTADTAGKPFIVAWTISGGGTNEIQQVTIVGATGGTFLIKYQGASSTAIDFDATAEEVKTAIESIAAIGADNTTVTGGEGGPWTIEFVGDLAGQDIADLVVDTENLTLSPEVQVIDLLGATGGTFTVKYGLAAGSSTSALAYNVSAADLQTALETETVIGVGNVSVAGSNGGPFTITFQGAYVNTNAQPLVVDGSSLTGGLADDVTVTDTTPGGDGGNEVWTIFEEAPEVGLGEASITLVPDSDVSGGTFDLSVTMQPTAGGSTTTLFSLTDVPYNVTASELQGLIDTSILSNDFAGYGKVVRLVSSYSNSRLSDGITMYLNIMAYIGDYTVQTCTLDATNLTGGEFSETVSDGIAEDISGRYPGLWKLIIDGEETDGITANAAESSVEAQIEELSMVGEGNVTVEYLGSAALRTISHGIRITFTGDLANQHTMFAVSAGPYFVGEASFESVRNYRGTSGEPEEQTISISGSPGSGNFVLRFDRDEELYSNSLDHPSGYSAPIAYNQTAAELEDILEAVDTIGTGNVSCSGGPFPDTDIVVAFQGTLAGINVELMTVEAADTETTSQGGGTITGTVVTTQSVLTQVTTTPNEGPNDYTTTENWNTNELPVDGDKVYIIDSAYSILYGLDQADVTLAELHIEQTFTGFIGLSIIHTSSSDSSVTYPEYRDLHLKIGATNVFIGDKEGAGSGRIKLDFGSVQTDILITNSGSRLDDSTPAIQLLGTHASNVLSLNRGDVGIAFYPGEVSTFPTIREAYIDNAESDSTLYIGDDVTLTNIYKSGGTLDLKSATTSIEQTAGTMTVYEGAHALINAYAGTVYYNSTGTLSEVGISGDTTLIFDQDRRAKDVTVINVYGSEPEVYDQAGCIASPEVNLQRGAKFEQLFFGSNVSVTIGSIA